jgi:hypothetical protein
MSNWFSDLFNSPRERAGEAIQPEFQNINNMGDAQSQYGLQPFDLQGYQAGVQSTFDPARRTLATKRGQALRRSLSSRNATPGMTNAGVEEAFAGADASLEGQQAGQELQGFDKQRESQQYNANFLRQLLGDKENSKYRKLGTLSDASTFDDIMAGANTVGSFYSAFNPPKPTRNYYGNPGGDH